MEENTAPVETAFKKPILIGKIGKLPKVIPIKQSSTSAKEDSSKINENSNKVTNDDITSDLNNEVLPEQHEEQETSKEKPEQPSKNVQFPYIEPVWSGTPDNDYEYKLEVLKQGSIIGHQSLEGKSYWVFGRLPQCDISMAHPTVSRYHAILQYRKEDTEKAKKGYYLFDLGSTHGTFLNKLRLKAQKYVKVQVGHMIKLGCSSRSYILVGPDDDREEESEFSITELKQKRQDEINRREALIEEAKAKAEAERLAQEKRDEERGVDWGLGEDADVETDLAENPYAQTNNEELYIDDPKKTLRGFMEREGAEFEYDCTEQGMGQFLCKVILPIDDERGRSIVAEVLHKGKKKEAVAQCALEACRILDRHGVLRQATHESKKRKAKDWQENDFYDSDDDTFLDRTGTIERKRENRMKAKQPQQVQTYQNLLDKEKTISKRINTITKELAESSRQAAQKVSDDVDPLDSFMAELKQPKLDKEKVMQLKTELIRLKQDHVQVIKLVNMARPADLPPLTTQYDGTATKTQNKKKFPMFGKRLKVKVEIPKVDSSKLSNEEDEDKIDEDVVEVSKANETEVEMEVVPVNAEASEVKICENIEEKQSDQSKTKDKVKIKEVSTAVKLIDKEGASSTNLVGVEKDSHNAESIELKRKKNQRRITQREEKQEKEKQRGYEEDFQKEDYNMWVPPQNQTGDGKTSLNDKFGY